jgi:hypothetical protein
MQLSVPLAPSYMNETFEKREGERESKREREKTPLPHPLEGALEVRGYGDVA